MKIINVVSALEQFAPLPLQEGYDNAGLQVGLTEAEVSGALLCLDVTEAIIDEAIRKECNLVVSHHPLIFHKLRRLCGEDYVQRTVMKALLNHITIVSMHTNMDEAEGGVNFKMAEKLGLNDLRFFGEKKQVALPEGMDDEIGNHIVQAGEGVIGTFGEPLAADDLVLLLKKTFEVACVQANELLRRPIRSVAICGGAGAFLLPKALAEGADAFITGEMHYHEYFGMEQQIQICVIGHYQSEQYTNEIFKSIIAEKCPGVRCCLAETCTNPIIYL